MKKSELEYLLKILERIKNGDEHVEKAKAYVKKDIAIYDARRGQMKDNYDYDLSFL